MSIYVGNVNFVLIIVYVWFFRMTTNEVVIDVEDQNDDEVEAPDKIRSIVWQHFPYKKGAQTSRCNHCKKAIACGTRMGTSGLLNHL